MNARVGAGLAIMAATGLLLVSACSSDDTTTTTTTTTTTSSHGGGGSTGGSGGSGDACPTACTDLFNCGQTNNLCPGMADLTLSAWLNGSAAGGAGGATAGCLDTCAANPALAALVDPTDCAGTVTTLSTLNPTFAATCQGAGGAGGGA
jgi:hypothetical protein